jgi:hypothetical protein
MNFEMNPDEKVARQFLIEQGLGEIIFEPKGQRTPDFSINNEIGVEVTRLNKYLESNPLEKLQFDLIPKIENLFKLYNDVKHSKSFFVGISFNRPLKTSKNLLEKVKYILDNHSMNYEDSAEYVVNDFLKITIIPSIERFDSIYVCGASHDGDRAGFVLSDISRRRNIIVPKIQEKVEVHLNDFKKWWLVLVDHIGYSLNEIEMEDLWKSFRLIHPFERIYLISPIDAKRGSFI